MNMDNNYDGWPVRVYNPEVEWWDFYLFIYFWRGVPVLPWEAVTEEEGS